MASRDGLGRTEAVGNSNTVLLAWQIAVSGSQLFGEKTLEIAICTGSNHRIAKPRRHDLALVWSNVHAKPEFPEHFLSKV